MHAQPHQRRLLRARFTRRGGAAALAIAPLVLGLTTFRALDRETTQPMEERFVSGLIGSAHDFSKGGAARDLCLPCHTPHITATQAPLLIAHGGATSQPARSYPSPAGSLDAASLVCLSCHDGTVARDVYAGAHAMSWSDLSGRSLRRDEVRVTNHPVGVKYPDGEREYHSAAAVERDGRIRLPGGRIQCTTCHDPHNRGNHGAMLVISNDRSRLCLSCHNL